MNCPKGAKLITLTQGKVALVDSEDFEWLNWHKWCAYKGGTTWYAVRNEYKNGKWKTIYMHRNILKPLMGLNIDHKDGNGLNNQRQNLRIVTSTQNHQNMKPRLSYNGRPTSSCLKGVSWHEATQKWQARIHVEDRRIHLGCFDSEVEAARAYDCAALKYFGEFSCTNFPRENYEKGNKCLAS